jgi:hypothetical protein
VNKKSTEFDRNTVPGINFGKIAVDINEIKNVKAVIQFGLEKFPTKRDQLTPCQKNAYTIKLKSQRKNPSLLHYKTNIELAIAGAEQCPNANDSAKKNTLKPRNAVCKSIFVRAIGKSFFRQAS